MSDLESSEEGRGAPAGADARSDQTSSPSDAPASGSGASEMPGVAEEYSASPDADPARPGGDPRKRRRRRGSRGGRGRSRSGGTVSPNDDTTSTLNRHDAPPGNATPDQSGSDPTEMPDPPWEGRATRPRIGDSRPAAPAGTGNSEPVSDSDENQGGGPARRRRRRGGRSRGAGKRPAAAVTQESVEPLVDAEGAERRRGRERNGRPVGRYMMCVHFQEKATQIAILEGRSLVEHYVSRPQDDATQIDGNIYMGRVQNVLPGMEAAFVDIGTPKNAVLYRGDVQYDPEDVEGELEGKSPGRNARIEQLLRPGQTVICQVTKNPIGTKGARLTQEVSLPGRFVVLVPNSSTYGISKRLPDDERKRLRRVLDEVKPAHHGLIVRTAADGATADELRRDVTRLVNQWQKIDELAKQSKAPKLLYREPDLAVRIIREEFNNNYRGVLIDDRRLYEEVHDYVNSISPELADRVEYYDEQAEGLPVFERHHVHEQLHKSIDRKVWLPSGGSLIIERTEALTVIDVNTGKNVGAHTLEETVYRNNLEAAEEVARQLRLRDIGGIIVIDFIDMEIKENRDSVIKTFREALARDKTRTQVFDISELGLVEMTRKRISEGLVESLSDTCPQCGGRGMIFDEQLLEGTSRGGGSAAEDA